MKKALRGIAILFAAFCLFGCDSPVEEKNDGPKEYEVMDLTKVINYTMLEYNKWGGPYSMLQSEDFEITDLFKGNLPKSGDTLHFTWTGKSDKDISKLYMIVPNIDILKLPDEWSRWTHLIPEKTYSIPVATDIKAREEFSIDVSLKLDYETEDFETAHNVHVFFCCALAESENKDPITLYTTAEVPDLTPPKVTLDGTTVKISKPGKEWLKKRTDKGCDGYRISIGVVENDTTTWVIHQDKTFLFTDKASFTDADLSIEFANNLEAVKNQKVVPAIHISKKIDTDEEEWYAEVDGTEIEFKADPDMTPVKLELEVFTVKVTPPSQKYLNALKTMGCDSYFLGIAAEDDDWEQICGTHFHLSDEDVFTAYDFSDDEKLKTNLKKIKSDKLSPVIHFYKNDVDKDDERVFLFGLRGPEITYTPES